MSPRDKILDTLAKLLRHAESAKHVGNFEEAETFAAKVNELLLKHNLDMMEVEGFEGTEEGAVEEEIFNPGEHGIPHSFKRIKWQQLLARKVADFNFCKILVMSGTNQIWFIGRKQDREVTTYLYSYLAREIIHHSSKEYDRAYYRFAERDGEPWRMRGFRASWIEGAIGSIARRFRDMKQAAEEEVGETKVNALVRVSGTAIAEFMEERYPKAKSAEGMTGQRGYNSDGYAKGAEWGKGVSISRGVGDGTGSSKGDLNA